MQPLISLVSGTFKRLPMLQDMIGSFRSNLSRGVVYEIVIVDGGSTDGTIEWCKSQSDIRLIEDGALLGAISAFTRGGQAAQGKYVLFANDDIQFFPDSIMPAIVYLENNPRCGAVAFADNRPMSDSQTRKDYLVHHMGALTNGKRGSIIYAQVGLYRKWLGDKLNWWLGEHEEMLGAQVYAGDNSLSAQIWNKGYTVDELQPCRVEDHIAHDELREINYQKGKLHDDSKYFYRQWPGGLVTVNSEPQIPQQDKRAARIGYLPIFEPGWPIQKHPTHGKNGLLKALQRAQNKFGVNHIVEEFDYLDVPAGQIRPALMAFVDRFQPDILLTQLQAHLPISAGLLQEIKARSGATVINWNGDQAPGGLGINSPEMLALLKQVDLQLIINMEAAPLYEREGIPYAYWQIGYELPEGNLAENVSRYFNQLGRENPLADVREYPVVYLANLRTPARQRLAEIVTRHGGLVCTPSDQYATLYNFSTSTLIYQRAKLIISDNGYNSPGFVSNRLVQAMSAGGGLVLQEHVERLHELMGLNDQNQPDTHYVTWRTEDELEGWITRFLDPSFDHLRRVTVSRGTRFIRNNFSFDAQVAKLMDLIKSHLGKSEQLKQSVALQYIGANPNGFGLGNAFPSGQRYEHQPGRLLYVKPEDADTIIRNFPNQWRTMDL